MTRKCHKKLFFPTLHNDMHPTPFILVVLQTYFNTGSMGRVETQYSILDHFFFFSNGGVAHFEEKVFPW